jgi:aminoglycoside 3'-phosphotransferase-2
MIELPAAWHDRLRAHDRQAQDIGKSDADVVRLRRDGQPDLFIKSEKKGHFCELSTEIAVLRWLERVDLPAPRVIEAVETEDRQWLLMTAVAGTDMASTPEAAPDQLVSECARALRDLHALDPGTCPFDRRLAITVSMAEERTRAGVVDETDFDDEHIGRTASELLARLTARQPTETDLVVCHGDACLPNFIVADGRFSGFIDCARLGVADRYQDLALATRSIAFNYGPEAVGTFLSAYGIDPDADRIAFYRLLDEFF